MRAFEHMPKVEVTGNDKSYTVTVERRGLDEKDMQVQLDDDVLTISGEKKVDRRQDALLGTQLRHSFTR